MGRALARSMGPVSASTRTGDENCPNSGSYLAIRSTNQRRSHSLNAIANDPRRLLTHKKCPRCGEQRGHLLELSRHQPSRSSEVSDERPHYPSGFCWRQVFAIPNLIPRLRRCFILRGSPRKAEGPPPRRMKQGGSHPVSSTSHPPAHASSPTPEALLLRFLWGFSPAGTGRFRVTRFTHRSSVNGRYLGDRDA